jgi:general secretion pathway protein J
MQTQQHRGIRGFTLVELLLALTLMSMLLALAYGGLRASTRATDKGQAILEDSSRIRMAHQFVRKQLNQMVPLVFEESENGEERAVFRGDAGSIRFVAPMPGYLGFGGPQVQELSLVPGENGLELVLSHALLQNFEEQNLYARPSILLLDQIAEGSFSFLGRDENDELTGWSTQWADPALLPEAVALEIEFEEDVYIHWPLLTAAVRINPDSLEGLAGDQLIDESYSRSIRTLIDRNKQKQ